MIDLQLAAKREKKAAYYAEKKERREVRRAVKKAKKEARKNSKGGLAQSPPADATADEDEGKESVAFWSGPGDAPPADHSNPPEGAHRCAVTLC